MARFVEPDPVDPISYDSRTLNRYVYARNDPVHRLDPTGRMSFVEVMVVVTIVKVLASVAIAVIPGMLDIVLNSFGFFKKFGGTVHAVKLPSPSISYSWGFSTASFELEFLQFLDGPLALYLTIGGNFGYSTGHSLGGAITTGIVLDTPELEDYEGVTVSLTLSGGYVVRVSDRLVELLTDLPLRGHFDSTTLNGAVTAFWSIASSSHGFSINKGISFGRVGYSSQNDLSITIGVSLSWLAYDWPEGAFTYDY